MGQCTTSKMATFLAACGSGDLKQVRKKILEEGVVTNFKVVADQIIVKKIVRFLNSFTLKGWTNLIEWFA